jgi:hypothetical protein
LENTRTSFNGGSISHILIFYWFEPVLYLDSVSTFPETTERPGYFVGIADNVGDTLTFKILKKDLSTVYTAVLSDLQQMPIIKINGYHLSQMYKK